MKTRLRQAYDDFYYNFSKWVDHVSGDLSILRRTIGKKYDQNFYDVYHNEVVPYWRKFGIKPKMYRWKQLYDGLGYLDPRLIPDDIYLYRILPRFNDCRYTAQLADKNLNSLLFPYIKRPETVFKRVSGRYCNDDFSPITKAEAVSRLTGENEFVIKPTRDSCDGLDITFFRTPISNEELERILKAYEAIDFIVQRAVVQHPNLAALNPTSVNTIRIVTLVYHEEVIVLSSILRVGGSKNRVDNISAGGYQLMVNPDGTLNGLALTEKSGKTLHVETTADGVSFAGVKIPCYNQAVKTVTEAAVKVPHVGLIGWDLAIDNQDDVVLIEFNIIAPGQNQGTNGPTFGNRTDEILSDIFSDSYK